MLGICGFCNQLKELTRHERIAQAYGGRTDDPSNVIPNICRECHTQLENTLNRARAALGAGKNVPEIQTVTIGQIQLQQKTGSVYLNEQGMTSIDTGSPFYGMSCHNQLVGQKYTEAALSGGSVALVTGSPACTWVIYSFAVGSVT